MCSGLATKLQDFSNRGGVVLLCRDQWPTTRQIHLAGVRVLDRSLSVYSMYRLLKVESLAGRFC